MSMVSAAGRLHGVAPAPVRETWNEGRVSLSFAPRRGHRPPPDDACAARLGRWLCAVQGSQLWAGAYSHLLFGSA
jgi:hypothetical protein